MTKKLFIVCAALVWTVALVAQNISVVAANGSTKLYRTLQAAIEGADPNSTIYLPGGGFSIADSVKITKKLTIIGIGHYVKSGNVDGVSNISGNLFFNEGSSGSAVMGCYITGNVSIGEGGAEVNDVLIKYCNLNSVQTNNSLCFDIFVSQNFIRGTSNFGEANSKISNNVANSIINVTGGYISNNIITGYDGYGSYYSTFYKRCIYANNSTVINNIIIPNEADTYNCVHTKITGTDNEIDNNMSQSDVGENTINIGEDSWDEIFVDFNDGAISPSSNFHFKDDSKQYENQVGIYAGDGFNDKQLAPVPYIVAKKIDEQTDAAGKLNIKIRVKASGEE